MSALAQYLAAEINLRRLTTLYQDTRDPEARILAKYASNIVERFEALVLYEREQQPRIERQRLLK